MNHCRKTQDKLSFPRNYALLPLPNFGLTVCLGVKVFDVKERGKGQVGSRMYFPNSNWSIKPFLLLPMFVLLISLFFENTETCRRPNQHNPCYNSSDAKNLAVPREDINLTFHKHSTDGGFSVNISWIHPTGKFDLLVSSSSSVSLLEILVSQNLRDGRGERIEVNYSA